MKEETFKYIGDKPWEYLPVVNECIKILLTIGLGILSSYFGIFEASKFVPQATRFVFYIALPLLVLKAIGIGIDFYDDTFLWRYIFAFLVLRAIALVICIVVVVLVSRKQRQQKLTSTHQEENVHDTTSTTTIGQIAVSWLSLTWISTIILGVPISSAVFGDPSKGRMYGILAAISSFIFQLPIQLFFLECHLLIKEGSIPEEPPNGGESSATDDEENQKDDDGPVRDEECASPTLAANGHNLNQEKCETEMTMWLHLITRLDIWKKILRKILENPVLWGIAGGFVLSLSTIGPRFLNPSSPDFVPGFQWFFAVTSWLGECVSPLSLFSMGVWMQSSQIMQILFGRISFLAASLSMISKLVIVPFVMIWLAKVFDLNDEAGRAAVLIASLPISMASFSLGSRYKVGEMLLSQNVALGTALILPAVLLWNITMDALNLFPLPE